MGVPKARDIRNIICSYLNLFVLTEVVEFLKTNYEKILNQRKYGFLVDVYKFKTNKNKYYNVEFFKDFLVINNVEYKVILLGFSPTEVADNVFDSELITSL
jgi:hypothetical protein